MKELSYTFFFGTNDIKRYSSTMIGWDAQLVPELCYRGSKNHLNVHNSSVWSKNKDIEVVYEFDQYNRIFWPCLAAKSIFTFGKARWKT